MQTAVTRDPETGVDLRQLIEDELLAYGATLAGQVTAIEGPPIALGPKPAELIGLAIHELTNNAHKYGALAGAEGRISVTWSILQDEPTPMFRLEWKESGVKINQQPTRRGFGTELLRGRIAYELDGETIMQFGNGGLYSEMLVPISRLPS